MKPQTMELSYSKKFGTEPWTRISTRETVILKMGSRINLKAGSRTLEEVNNPSASRIKMSLLKLNKIVIDCGANEFRSWRRRGLTFLHQSRQSP